MDNPRKLLEFAGALARRMGDLARTVRSQPSFVVHTKADRTLVTEADQEAERIAVEAIRSAFPTHSILGEEGGISGERSPYVWVIDPIDGTTNYSRGIPLYAVSLALLYDHVPLVAVTYAPAQNELCAAVRGEGATCNGEPLSCRSFPLTSESTFGIGSVYRHQTPPAFLWRVFTEVKMRNTGSAVLNMIYVALNRFDCCVLEYVKLWDVAAATLICSEAGALVASPQGKPLFPLTQPMEHYARHGFSVFAASPDLFEPIRQHFLHDYAQETVPLEPG